MFHVPIPRLNSFLYALTYELLIANELVEIRQIQGNVILVRELYSKRYCSVELGWGRRGQAPYLFSLSLFDLWFFTGRNKMSGLSHLVFTAET